jgi:hypothetical protein
MEENYSVTQNTPAQSVGQSTKPNPTSTLEEEERQLTQLLAGIDKMISEGKIADGIFTYRNVQWDRLVEVRKELAKNKPAQLEELSEADRVAITTTGAGAVVPRQVKSPGTEDKNKQNRRQNRQKEVRWQGDDDSYLK